MIIDTEKIEKLLADETVSAYEIESKSGVNRTVLTKLRRGEADLDNMTLKNLKKLMEYIERKENTSGINIQPLAIEWLFYLLFLKKILLKQFTYYY